MPKTEVMHTINRYVLILVALTALAAVPTARAQTGCPGETGPGDPLRNTASYATARMARPRVA